MNGNSILIGRAFGIPIRIHILLVIFAPIFALWYSSSMLLGLLMVAGVFASVALHELGHSVVAMRKGCHVEEIVLSPIGGAAKMTNLPTKPWDEIQIALAGPAVSLILGLIGFLSGIPLLQILGVINLFLFGFNLIPCFPMDGGRVLRAFLAIKRNRLDATRIAVQIGKYFCIFFVVFGLLNRMWILAFIGLYIWQAGQMEYRMLRLQHQAHHFSGFRDGHVDVEVSPPPYARGARNESLAEKIRNMFGR